jgi:orotate phosphoribosyltransferase
VESSEAAHFCGRKCRRPFLRREFKIAPNEKFIVAEEVVTRGGRVKEAIDIVRAHGGTVVAGGMIVDRSGNEKPDFAGVLSSGRSMLPFANFAGVAK